MELYTQMALARAEHDCPLPLAIRRSQVARQGIIAMTFILCLIQGTAMLVRCKIRGSSELRACHVTVAKCHLTLALQNAAVGGEATQKENEDYSQYKRKH
jgi:hypothetical protein